MTDETTSIAGETLNCWNEIGILGDRSCRELTEMIHCRNCPVFARAAQAFFERTAPRGYLTEWSDQLADQVAPADTDTISLLIFRLGDEWFGARSQVVVEVTLPRPIHSIPHRKSRMIEGLVSLRGQLQLQVCLKELFGVSRSGESPSDPSAKVKEVNPRTRLVVLRQGGETWGFLVDEVHEVKRFSIRETRDVPSTLSNAAFSFSQAILIEEGRTIGYLDDVRLFKALRDLQG